VKLSILVPVYNERETISEILRRVRAVELEGIEREIIVVDDCSTDGTAEILEQEARHADTHVFTHERNQGKGAAVRTALQHATGDILLIQDADLEYDPREYPLLLQPILENRSQVVYGSRFLGGPRKAMFFWHMVGNKVLTFITNLLYNTILTDMETCYKVFTREVADRGAHLLHRARDVGREEDQLAGWVRRAVDAAQVSVCGMMSTVILSGVSPGATAKG